MASWWYGPVGAGIRRRRAAGAAAGGGGGGGNGILAKLTHAWYFDETGAGDTRADAIGGLDLVPTGGDAQIATATGFINGGVQFVQADAKCLESGGYTREAGMATKFSVVFCHKMKATPASRYSIVGDVTGNGEFGIENRLSGSGRILICINGFTNYGWTNSVFTTSMKQFVVVYDGTQADNATRLKLYANGSPVTLSFVGTIPASVTLGTAALQYGNWSISAQYGDSDGDDEFYIAEGTALTEDDAVTLHNSGTGARPS